MNPLRIPLLLLVLALLPAPTHADAVDDAVRAHMDRNHVPGLSLAVVRNGELLRAQGYGLANVEHDVPATKETVYQIQSITKTFTAAGVMMLVESGQLRLDDPVDKHVAGAPDAWKGITLRHLLTHTSGIPDFINRPTVNLRLDVTPDEVLKSVADKPLEFPTGDRYAYSNTNYHLLGMVIDRVSGRPWQSFLQERIWDPLGMKDTRIISLADPIPHRAAGYLFQNGALQNGRFVAPSILGYAGGGIRSTVVDMAKYDTALNGERILKRATLEEMWTPTKLNGGGTSAYGLGWALGNLRGCRTVNHSGSHMTGFQSQFTRYRDRGLTVVALTNLQGARPGPLADQVAGLLDPSLAAPQPPKEAPAKN